MSAGKTCLNFVMKCAHLAAGVSDAGLQAVAALFGLTHLNLDSRHVTDDGLAHLTSIESSFLCVQVSAMRACKLLPLFPA